MTRLWFEMFVFIMLFTCNYECISLIVNLLYLTRSSFQYYFFNRIIKLYRKLDIEYSKRMCIQYLVEYPGPDIEYFPDICFEFLKIKKISENKGKLTIITDQLEQSCLHSSIFA